MSTTAQVLAIRVKDALTHWDEITRVFALADARRIAARIIEGCY